MNGEPCHQNTLADAVGARSTVDTAPDTDKVLQEKLISPPGCASCVANFLAIDK